MGKVDKLCVVISGPSGVGKDQVMNNVLKNNCALTRFVTDTNRKPRDNEIDGVDYHFKTTSEFEKGIANGDYLEFVEYRHGEYKGINKNALVKTVSKTNTVLRIDPSATANIRNIFVERIPVAGQEIADKTISIYIHPGDWSTIEKRYFDRDPLANKETFRVTFEKDQETWKQNQNKYDYVVANLDGMTENTVKIVDTIVRRHQQCN